MHYKKPLYEEVLKMNGSIVLERLIRSMTDSSHRLIEDPVLKPTGATVSLEHTRTLIRAYILCNPSLGLARIQQITEDIEQFYNHGNMSCSFAVAGLLDAIPEWLNTEWRISLSPEQHISDSEIIMQVIAKLATEKGQHLPLNIDQSRDSLRINKTFRSNLEKAFKKILKLLAPRGNEKTAPNQLATLIKTWVDKQVKLEQSHYTRSQLSSFGKLILKNLAF